MFWRKRMTAERLEGRSRGELIDMVLRQEVRISELEMKNRKMVAEVDAASAEVDTLSLVIARDRARLKDEIRRYGGEVNFANDVQSEQG